MVSVVGLIGLFVAIGGASMEPCLFRHGKGVSALFFGAVPAASMEPCLFRHGKTSETWAKSETCKLLQWSHVFSDMVRVALILHPTPEAVSFNGAMSFQTW